MDHLARFLLRLSQLSEVYVPIQAQNWREIVRKTEYWTRKDREYGVENWIQNRLFDGFSHADSMTKNRARILVKRLDVIDPMWLLIVIKLSFLHAVALPEPEKIGRLEFNAKRESTAELIDKIGAKIKGTHFGKQSLGTVIAKEFWRDVAPAFTEQKLAEVMVFASGSEVTIFDFFESLAAGVRKHPHWTTEDQPGRFFEAEEFAKQLSESIRVKLAKPHTEFVSAVTHMLFDKKLTKKALEKAIYPEN